MKRTGKIILTLIFLVLSTISYSQSLVVFQELTHDFGKVELTSDTLVAQFWFKNKGCSNLEIYMAKGSCGCTVTQYPQTTSANSGGSITVKYYNANPGPINKSVTVQTNDPNNPVVILRIKGETYKPE